MIRGKWICLIAVLIPLLAASASGNDTLNKAIIDGIVELYSLDTNVVQVEIVKNRLSADLKYDSLSISPMTRGKPQGLLPILITLYSEKNQIAKGQIRIRIRYFADVLVTTDKIRRHDILDLHLVVKERRDVTSITEKPLISTESFTGFWAKRNIGKNQILTSGMIEKIPDVTSGEKVSITFRAPAFEVISSGIAMEKGYIGDVIRVRNNHSRKIVACTIVDTETVQVSSH
jgi:flagella basal body P-ring formation protein FlgA